MVAVAPDVGAVVVLDPDVESDPGAVLAPGTVAEPGIVVDPGAGVVPGIDTGGGPGFGAGLELGCMHSAQTSEKVWGESAPPVCVNAVQDAAVVMPLATGAPVVLLGKLPLR
jgi:hypothetical protein